jgi:spore coat polysaccharide biosynthesis protein SpsF
MVTATIVTARLGSSRLPRKVLTPLRGRSALERLVERLRLARRPDLILLATTTLPEDDELCEIAGGLGLAVARGSADDILDRWLQAARAHGPDLIVACDGDDVFCDPVHVDRVVERHESSGADYVSCVGLPFGTAPTGIAVGALARVCELKQETNTEGQGRFFEDPRVVSRAEVTAPAEVRHDEARMTLDYPEDVRFLEAVIDELERPGEVFSLAEIVALLRRRPDIVAINAARQKEYWRRFHERYPPVELGSG